MNSKMRKTRFVCISDTHNCGGAFKLPKGDVLIHAGDLTNQGSFAELEKAVKWLEETEFEMKIVIAGIINLAFTLIGLRVPIDLAREPRCYS